EALQRVPGVSLETDSGEGRFINIRGMDADLNGTTFDGVRLTASNPSTPQGGGRAVAFDAFPTEIVGGIEVIKSLTPDIDAEGLGGVVNMLPRTIPQDKSSFVEASAGTGIETLRDSPVWNGSVTGGMRFGPSDSIAAILSYSYDSDWRGIDDIEEDYFNFPADKRFDDLQLRRYQYHRVRQGLGGGITWDVDNNTTLYVRGFHAGYTEWANKHRLELDSLGDDAVQNADGSFSVPDATASQKFTDSKEEVTNDLIYAGGHTTFGSGMLVDYRASWTKGIDRFPYSYSFTFTDPNDIALTYNNIADPSHPRFAVTDGTKLADPSLYPFDKGDNGPSVNWDEEFAGVVNFTMPLPLIGHDGTFKFGGSVRARQRHAIAAAADIADGAPGLSSFAGGPDQIYYDATYDIGPNVDYKAMAGLPQGVPLEDPSTFENDHEDVYAGYAQYSTTVEGLDLLGGVRVENTNATYRANAIDGNGNLIGPSLNKQDYTDVFPDVNAKYQLMDDLVLRAAFSTSIARPGFNQITAAKTLDFDNNVVSQGNPSLKPTTADNYDLTAEYYLPNGGIASGGLFYKSFTDYIIPTVTFVNSYPGFTGKVEIDSFSNIGAAHAQGVELNYIQQFQFLPDPIDGLGFEGNVTFVGSRGDIRTGEEHTLPQTSPINYNAALFYEKGPLSLRLAASYVSRNLWAVGGDPTTDLYSQPRFRLDFGSTYQINDNYEFYFNVKNITDTKLEFSQGPSINDPIQREFYSVDYLAGIKARF
ncbi:MAG TPA: TonB-dependent receptor, partial [Rhizomicrobium sp.]|nr:TonB-dependent receptor [Rhizomicrobium sp.]